MSKTIYITDLDGTLLDNNSLITAKSAGIITELSRQGALISIATARTPGTVVPLLEHTLINLPAITFTGAALWNCGTRSYEWTRPIDRQTADAILNILESHGINPFVYHIADDSVIDASYNGPVDNTTQKFIDARSHLAMKRMHINCEKSHSDSPPLLIFALGNLDRLQKVAGTLRDSVDCSLSCYPDIFDPGTGYLEIFAPGVSKAAAVLRLKEMAGADRMVVFGDNLNDIPMMQQADVAVAVENALPEVKSHATLTIGPNTDDSVARFIEQDFRSQLSDVKTHYNK